VTQKALREKKFLLQPIYFMLIVILVDKVFLLDTFQNQFLQKGNQVFYIHRRILYETLIQDPIVLQKKKKLAIALGDSRSYPFSEQGLPEGMEKEWTVYNFSGPQAVPMYSLQCLERILEAGIVPDLIYLSLSPEAFDDSKGFIHNPFMRHGMDQKFRNTYWEYLPWKDRYNYFMDLLFSFRRLEFDSNLFLERWLEGNLDQYDPNRNEDMLVLKMGKGEYLAYAAIMNAEPKLTKDAIRIRALYLENFQLSWTQYFFVEKILSLAKARGSKVFVVWPRVYKDYREAYRELNLETLWWSKIEELSRRYGSIPVNWNDDSESDCDLFNDASHQSIYCYREQMAKIFKKLQAF